MDYRIAAHTDVGIKKNVNQDSLLVNTAVTPDGKILMAVVCDGMGGLSQGEVASATLINRLDNWFQGTLPTILGRPSYWGRMEQSLKILLETTNRNLSDYGDENGWKLGTTVVVLIVIGNEYMICNIGDSRAYFVKNDIIQLTKDQTYVQREVDLGRMTPEEALVSPQKNVLLQCIGASDVIEPDFYYGNVDADSVFFLCSDGFRHVLQVQELYTSMNPFVLFSEEQMHSTAVMLVDTVKQRMEEDNISVIIIKTVV